MKDNIEFENRYRLGTCVPGGAKEFIPLQAADLIAYETYRYLGEKEFGEQKTRIAMKKLLPTNGFSGYYMGAKLFARIKDDLESSNCSPGGYIIL